jgi:hypothetical protein
LTMEVAVRRLDDVMRSDDTKLRACHAKMRRGM